MAVTKKAKQGKALAKGGSLKPERGLSPKQRAFCREYLVDLNATRAAIRAGYSERTAGAIGEENLKKPEIATEVQRLMAEREKRTEVTADAVLKELASMAFYDPAAIGSAEIRGPEDIAKLPEDVRRCIVGWSWDKAGNFTLKLAGKTQQLELIGRHLGMFRDKLEHSGPEGGPLVTASTLSPEQIAQVERIRERRAAIKDGA
ncbi:terminase small subunit [Luteolibacter sp. GHJ8]|uniref:Terminase small subunit n=1 Tax=Luteolibacter rhizosphaerae TaxID=2989719 RepID=A0ABT3G209_9BACT|nr:terminase small subunit [Luteolibacter rhizosphaerae]MCW1913712.1 terminase small subunit [Luteolibacter rhizosphaerae]